MKAMILAAGKGTRVRPLTHLVPKPMIPLLGRPIMEYIVDHLRQQGFDEIVVNTSYLATQIHDYFRDGARHGVQMGFSFEGSLSADGTFVDEPVGSAGGMRRVQDFSGFFDDTFAVLCGDAIVDVDLQAALRRHRATGAIATLITREVTRDEVSSYGIAVTDPDGRVRSFQEKPKPVEALGTTAHTGIYLFEPAIFEFIPRSGVCDIGSQLFPSLIDSGAPLYAVSQSFQWVDVGNSADYWRATMRLLRGEIPGGSIPGRVIEPGIHTGINVALPDDRSRFTGPIWIGASASIGSDVTIVGPAAIGAGCVIEGGAVIERSIVWDYTRVSGAARLTDKMICGPYCVTSEGASVSLRDVDLSWLIDDARREQAADEYAVLAALRDDR